MPGRMRGRNSRMVTFDPAQPHGAEFEADVAGADDDQMFRDFGKVDGLGAAADAVAIHIDAAQLGGLLPVAMMICAA